MNELTNKTIREIALDMPAAIRVFEELKIDYCCGGGKNFADACEHASISPGILMEKISTAVEDSVNRDSTELHQGKSSGELVDHIVDKHHTFAKREMDRLTPLMEKVCIKHGDRYPELIKLQQVFRVLCNDLSPHMQKEEIMLFPYIKNLQIASDRKTSVPTAHFGTIQNPIRMMMMEHDTVGDLLREMRVLANDFFAPENACPSYKALYFGLEELEKDLHLHIHLENNLLFPNALKLERSSYIGSLMNKSN